MKHVIAAIAAVTAVAFVPACASGASMNAVSARAPGFLAPVEAPATPWTPVIDVGFPNDGWASHAPMPSGRWAHAMASYSEGTYPNNNAYVYVIAGADASFANTGAMSRYDVTLDTWSDMAPLNPARSQISAARIGTKIYVPGGYGGSFSPVATLSIYDIASDTWTTGATLPQATGDYAIGTYSDRFLYVIGGYSGSADLNTVQVYDTTTNTWQIGTPKPGTAAAGLRGGIAGNRIIVAGGYSQTLGTELADTVVGTIDPVTPTNIAWTVTTPYPGGTVGRFGAGVPVAAGPAQGASALNVVIFTGGDPSGQGIATKNDTWLYDFNTDSWKSGPTKPTAVSNIDNMAGVASGGKVSMVSTGGYDGNVIVAVNEWLELGQEAPADVALAMSDGGTPIQRGATVVYALDYTVSGPGSAPAVSISDTVPAGTAFDAAASTPGWTCTPDASAGSACVFSLGDLADASSGTVQFALDSIAPVAPATTQIVNTAIISTVATLAPEQDTANNQATVTTPYFVPAILDLTGGSPQTATVDTAFATPLEVHVADANGIPLVGVAIDFSGPAAGASAALSASTTTTDVNGDASIGATANAISGAYTIAANVAGYAGIAPVAFALANSAGAPAILSVISGSPQSTPIATAFTVPLVAQVRDANNNPVAGATVAFAVPTSGPSATLSASSPVTDANGIVAITAVANQEVGAYGVDASVPSTALTAPFALTNLVADVALSASIDDLRDFAQYGHTLDYIITVSNAGASDAHHVNVASVLPAQVDVAYATWSCLIANGCVASGSGNLSDADVTVPAHGLVAWILSAPILFDSAEVPVVTTVSASSPDQVAAATASDSTILVIFRDGVDRGYADGADGIVGEPQKMTLRSNAEMKLALPPNTSGNAIDTVLDARSPGASGFRIDRLTHADATWLRLVAISAAGTEQATTWLRVDTHGDVALRLVVDAGRGSVALVNGGRSVQLELGKLGVDAAYSVNAVTFIPPARH